MGKGLKNVFDFIFYSNLFISVCGFCFTFFSGLVLEFSPAQDLRWYCLLVSLSVFFVYGFQRLALVIKMLRNKEAVPDSISVRDFWMIRNMKLLAALLLISGAGIVFLIFYIDWKLVLYFSPLLLVCVLYFAGPFPLKKIPGIKSFIIAFVWTAVAVEIPRLFFRGGAPHYFPIWYAIGQFLFIAALCTPFDIRDYESDLKNNVRSLPVVMGINKAKLLSVIFLAVYPLITFFSPHINFVFFCGTLLSAVCGIVVVMASNLKRSNFYYSFFVDGMLIVQLLSVIIVAFVFPAGVC